MKYLSLLAAFGFVSLGNAEQLSVSNDLASHLLLKEFKAFIQKYKKPYDHTHEAKLRAFAANLEEVVQLNSALRTLGKDEVHGITKFRFESQSQLTLPRH